MENTLLDTIVLNCEMLNAIRYRRNIDSTVEALKEDLGISRSTADKMVSSLKDQSLIFRQDRKTLINGEAALFLGISIGSKHIRLQLLGLDFQPISRESLRKFPCLLNLETLGDYEDNESDNDSFSYKTPFDNIAEDTFLKTRNLISNIIHAFLEQTAKYRNLTGPVFPLMGIGLAVTGPVDFDAHLWQSAPRFTAVRNITLMDLIGYDNYQFATELGIFFSLDNNAKTAMISEYQYLLEKYNGQFSEDIALLYIGSGVGSSAVIDGKLLRGSQNLSGELGHLQILSYDNQGNISFQHTIESCLATSEMYEQYLPYILNTINCVLGIDRVILIGHSIQKNDRLIPLLMGRRMEFTVTSTQHFCKPEIGRRLSSTSAIGAAIEAYMTMCCYDPSHPEDRINLAKEIHWK